MWFSLTLTCSISDITSPKFVSFVNTHSMTATDINWYEISELDGEIYDVPELQDEDKFDINEYINGNIDY